MTYRASRATTALDLITLSEKNLLAEALTGESNLKGPRAVKGIRDHLKVKIASE